MPDLLWVIFSHSWSLYVLHSQPILNFLLHFPSSNGDDARKSFQRQNYLRKKLTQQQQQFQQASGNQTPRNLDKVDFFDSEFVNSVEGKESLNEMNVGGNLRYSDDTGNLVVEPGNKKFGESMMWNKLESWVEQYKKDLEFWGIGTRPIFIVYQDSGGTVERVVVDEEEILRRSRVDPQLDNESEEMDEVNFKISFAKDLAREMENGGTVISKNSSVAKFLPTGEESKLMETINGVALKPGLISRMSRVGVLVLCSVYVIWAIGKRLTTKKDDRKYTRLEKEMLRRKIKAREQKEKLVMDSVEVVKAPKEHETLSLARPNLDKEALMNSIIEVKKSNSKLKLAEESTHEQKEFEAKLEEIRAMARHARETESGNTAGDNGEEEKYQDLEDLPDYGESQENKHNVQNRSIGKSADECSTKESEAVYEDSHGVEVTNPCGSESTRPQVCNKSSDLDEAKLDLDSPGSQSDMNEISHPKKLKIITSAKEARKYLLRKNNNVEANKKHKVKKDDAAETASTMARAIVESGHADKTLNLADDTSRLGCMHGFLHLSDDHSVITETAKVNVVNPCDLEKSRVPAIHEVSMNKNEAGISMLKMSGDQEDETKTSQNNNCIKQKSSVVDGAASTSAKVDCEDLNSREVSNKLEKQNSDGSEKNESFAPHQVSGITSVNDGMNTTAELSKPVKKENWIENNFNELEPILEKIGIGFRENYLVAREKAAQELDSKIELAQLQSEFSEEELGWMKDERLREIVFKVRENELSGRDPFHDMEDEDKSMFLCGLEQKVDKVNEKMLKLHEYLHSNIENLDYGADGISVYDPPEKIIPRWKDPPVEKSPEFLENFMQQRKVLAAESLKNSSISKNSEKSAIRNSEDPSSQDNLQEVSGTEHQKDILASSKTVIQGSDGSVKKGKRSGKEFWQHTKKWSQGFLESYNAEEDPEVKAVMRDMGKDLDRWITEKEIKEAAELMDKLPEKGQKFIKQKLDKVKREMELFGPQAVVSKYREYAEEKEEDYLWWLDLPFVLCLELYTVDNGERRVGLYSLEMAEDLELEPKQYHVIAFEDASDCKSFCYIIQAQMEVQGNGNAFVVARPPKDAFREAKANGFSVTVIRKGQLQLNIDQTLDEVEESIKEIGSKIYHDKIMKERGVDVNSLMKGVFGISKSTKRKRSKQILKHINP
ncbi:uncharacterized protein LOC127243807 isoform X2 [Andrographis paniculata]|uniref:uncharacterized protein LOC127243807 isoform X2 n=1 Tax=Andrographis paniculata TaxID=175694 RepID=UPI0021E7DE04|nr:uncharacterized protein LOC127243807 isoform X2 [Andrographis paniculata]